MGALLLSDGQCCCGRCRYPLIGLTIRGRCPECGDAYDLNRPARQATADEVASELAAAPLRAARRYWDDFAPGPRTVMMLLSVLGTSTALTLMGWLALKALQDRLHWW